MDGQEEERKPKFLGWLVKQDQQTKRVVFQVLDTALDHREQLEKHRDLAIFEGIRESSAFNGPMLNALDEYLFVDRSFLDNPGKLAEEIRYFDFQRPVGPPLALLPVKKRPSLQEILRKHDQKDRSRCHRMVESFEHAQKLKEEHAAMMNEKYKQAVGELPSDDRELQELQEQLYDAIVNDDEIVEQKPGDTSAVMMLFVWVGMDNYKIELLCWDILLALKNLNIDIVNMPRPSETYGTFNERFEAIKTALRSCKTVVVYLIWHYLPMARFVAQPIAWLKHYKTANDNKAQVARDTELMKKGQQEKGPQEKGPQEKGPQEKGPQASAYQAFLNRSETTNAGNKRLHSGAEETTTGGPGTGKADSTPNSLVRKRTDGVEAGIHPITPAYLGSLAARQLLDFATRAHGSVKLGAGPAGTGAIGSGMAGGDTARKIQASQAPVRQGLGDQHPVHEGSIHDRPIYESPVHNRLADDRLALYEHLRSKYGRPIHEHPIHESSIHDRPIDDRSVPNRLANDRLGYGHQGYDNPAYSRSEYDRLVSLYGRPIREGSIHGGPIHEGPIHDRPVHDRPIHDHPVYSPSVYSPPVYNQPVPDEPSPKKRRLNPSRTTTTGAAQADNTPERQAGVLNVKGDKTAIPPDGAATHPTTRSPKLTDESDAIRMADAMASAMVGSGEMAFGRSKSTQEKKPGMLNLKGRDNTAIPTTDGAATTHPTTRSPRSICRGGLRYGRRE